MTERSWLLCNSILKPLLYPTSETEIVRLRRENEKLKYGKEVAEVREDEKWREKEELHCYTYLYQNFKLADKSIVLNGAYKGLMSTTRDMGRSISAKLAANESAVMYFEKVATEDAIVVIFKHLQGQEAIRT
ncbi:unnamed protein product [Clonostachys rhizophaga]|uniref:Uncharacterized protein n=1 Tax=Clonostachys rhizophaga TaxID=160324 RepID=A0A9N9YJI4_9HYPO|nr:unnamed protein product [Clonostachys rhizophaga]